MYFKNGYPNINVKKNETITNRTMIAGHTHSGKTYFLMRILKIAYNRDVFMITRNPE